MNVRIPYNCTYSTSSKPEAETVKLAGRQRPTVGFGEGGEVSWSINGLAIMNDSEAATSLETTDEDALRNLPLAGIQVLRFPDGTRAQVYVSSVSVSRADASGLRNISITAEEVS